MHFIYTDIDHLELCIPQFIDFNAILSNWHAFKLGFNSAVYSVDETVDWLWLSQLQLLMVSNEWFM